MLVSALLRALRIDRIRARVRPPGCDPIDDPAIARMRLTELADLPFPRLATVPRGPGREPDGDLSATVSACRCGGA